LKRIEEIEAIIRSQPCKDDVDRQALTRLVQRKTWLTTTSPVEAANLLNLEQQVIHGDYQESNVFFYGGQISAIIDWDSTYPAPRAWEVVRALHYLFGFDGVASHRFCNAYCQVLPLSLADLEVAAAVYGWIREHDLWVFEELYVKGNRRVRPFIRPGNFVPLAHRWVPLQRVLCQSKTDK
jgi:homoserine kinase type II